VARLFFAVGVSPQISSRLAALQLTLGQGGCGAWLRFAPPEQAHYTLRFLGEEPEERQAAAARAGRATMTLASSFDLVLQSLGVFPDERRAHTLWIGASQGAEQLVELAAALDANLVKEGFSPQDRPFVPHLTLARLKKRIRASSLEALLKTSVEPIGSLRVDRFMLMESRSTGSGVRYVRLEDFRLEVPCTRSR
jgi:2'-5' RNA ligase